MGIILFLALGAIMAFWAYRKGFNPALWFLAAGIVGVVVLAFLESANAPNIDDKAKNERRMTGNLVGGIFTGIWLVLTIGVTYLAS